MTVAKLVLMPSCDVYYLASTEIETGIATHSQKKDTSRATPPLHWSCGQDPRCVLASPFNLVSPPSFLALVTVKTPKTTKTAKFLTALLFKGQHY